MMNNNVEKKSLAAQVGQSLVETALFMPILLIMIVGLVEVSQMVITQNRISTAARNAARFGAQGGEDLGIQYVTLNTVTQTLDLNSGVWDVFSLRGELDRDGNLPEGNFSYQHIYGEGHTQSFTATVTSEAWEDLREEIVDSLSYKGSSPGGLKFVGVLILHDIESILGLDIVPALLNRNTVRGFSIMRNSALATTVTQSEGCGSAYPLIIEQGIRSITERQFDAIDFEYPDSPTPKYNDFPGHVPERDLLGSAREGDLFLLNVIQGVNDQEAGLLFWGTGSNDHKTLVESMRYPPNSHLYKEPQDSSDTEMHVGDEVWRSSVNHTQFQKRLLPIIENHIDTGRSLRLLLWDNDEGPAASQFTITGFAIFKIRAYGDDGGPRGNWILLELSHLDFSCGQKEE